MEIAIINFKDIAKQKNIRLDAAYWINKSWHSAPFPKKLAENIIRYYSYENETVFDCFAGSGTTGKVAETLNRRWIMSELNTKIFNEAVERWQNGL